jgi:hypothetical protein
MRNTMGDKVNRAFICCFQFRRTYLLGIVVEKPVVKASNFIHIDGNGADVM